MENNVKFHGSTPTPEQFEQAFKELDAQARITGGVIMGEVIATREAYGRALCEFGADESIMVFDADLTICTMSCYFAAEISGAVLQRRDRGVQHGGDGGRSRIRQERQPSVHTFRHVRGGKDLRPGAQLHRVSGPECEGGRNPRRTVCRARTEQPISVSRT